MKDDQLPACRIWEYARESGSIRAAAEVTKAAALREGKPMPETRERAVFRAAVNDAYRLLHSTGLDVSVWVRLPFPQPWLSLGKRERAEISINPDASPCPPFRAVDLAANPVEWYTVAAQINFRDYADGEIVAGFRKWLKDERPKCYRKPKGRGHDPLKECRASLQRLGLLRLRSRHTLDETLAVIAKLDKELRRKTKFVEPSECNREVQKAVADFHLLLHLVPTETPLSWRLK